MKAVTPRQMSEIDRISINDFGIPGIVLMENAALKVVEEAEGVLGAFPGKRICVIAGKGNNGGDAFAAARHFFNKGAVVRVYTLAARASITGDPAVNLHILESSGAEVTELTGSEEYDRFVEEVSRADLIIDGIFGTGLKGAVEGFPGKVINTVNKAGKMVISIDIPSGIDGETGKVTGCCIKADKTVTFGLPKTGLLTHPGCEFTGELIVADIGIPEKAVEKMDLRTFLIDREMVLRYMPQRRSESSKGDYGKVLIVTGSAGMTGAGCLAAGAALRTGAGLVYMGVPSSLSSIYDIMLKEAVTIPLEDRGKGFLARECGAELMKLLRGKTVAAVGPGLSVNDETSEVVAEIVKNSEIPLVLDADALNVISKDVSVLKHIGTDMVITPHPGEMARLAGISVSDVQENRMDTAREFAARWKVITVLKGARTIVAVPDGSLYINPAGNSGMATGGTGDVLAGMIAGLIAQGAKPEEAAVAGVYIHGLAGDRAARARSEYGVIAGDVLEEIPYAIRELKHGL
jgi:hydroxyethylthiazole kinase-like uncharacterized protein yjeF